MIEDKTFRVDFHYEHLIVIFVNSTEHRSNFLLKQHSPDFYLRSQTLQEQRGSRKWLQGREMNSLLQTIHMP
jgi:hypothetical protein